MSITPSVLVFPIVLSLFLSFKVDIHDYANEIFIQDH